MITERIGSCQPRPAWGPSANGSHSTATHSTPNSRYSAWNVHPRQRSRSLGMIRSASTTSQSVLRGSSPF